MLKRRLASLLFQTGIPQALVSGLRSEMAQAILGRSQRLEQQQMGEIRSANRDILKHYWQRRMATLHEAARLPAQVIWRLSLLVEIWGFLRAAGPLKYEDVMRFAEYVPAFASVDHDTLSMMMELGESLGIFDSFTPVGTDHTLYRATARVPWTFSGNPPLTEEAQWTLPLDMLQNAEVFARQVAAQLLGDPPRMRTATNPGAFRTEGLLEPRDPLPGRLPEQHFTQLHVQLRPEQLEQLFEVLQAFLSAELGWHCTQGLYDAQTSSQLSDSLVFRAKIELVPERRSTGARGPGRSSLH